MKHYKSAKILLKFSECQVSLHKFKPPIQDFLAMVLVLNFTSFHATV